MGAPTKLTEDRQKTLCDAIAAGNYYEPACSLAGIAFSTFRRWMIEGEQAQSGAKRAFWEAVTRAEAEAEARVVAAWQARIPEDWQAARDFLMRRHPDRWGRSVQENRHTGKDADTPIQVEHAATPDSIAAFRATLAALGLAADVADAGSLLPEPAD